MSSLYERKEKNRITLSFIIAATVLFALAVLSVCVGKYPISVKEIFLLIFGGEGVSDITASAFFTLRLPRTVTALIAGVGLGVSGCVYQIIFKNPLASPDIIGVAGGANLGAAVAIVLASSLGMFAVEIGAFLGGIIAVLCVLLLARSVGANSTTYVLSGIIINAVAAALIMALKYFADPENELASIEYWEMGVLSNVTKDKLLPVLPVAIISLLGVFLLSRQIEMMALGDDECRSLGVRLFPLRTAVLILNTLLVSSVICVTGKIAFVGLIAPHVAKLMLKKSDKTCIFMSGLLGGTVVLLADVLTRVIYVNELPVSVLTTVIGVPVLLWFIIKRRGKVQ